MLDCGVEQIFGGKEAPRVAALAPISYTARISPRTEARPGTASISTVFTVGSIAQKSSALRIATAIGSFKAFSALGRFRVIRPKTPSRRKRTGRRYS